MNKLLGLLISLILSFTVCNISFAQTKTAPPKQAKEQTQAKTKEVKTQESKQKPPQPQATKQPPVQAESKSKVEEKKAAPTPEIQTITKILKEKETEECNCQKPVLDSIDKTYVAIEEDEWASAIKVCTDALNAVKNLSKTCTCLDAATYKNIAQAFLDYAKGGDILDGEKEPDCEAANKLYSETIKLLDEALPKVKDIKLKENIENIKDYSKEELEFVKDECSG